ncbi:MAG: hypothetical protein P9L88_01140 [Candidatus Tantalella remota]|nr:hypothetical protein [Candidatus Tantalella remota]
MNKEGSLSDWGVKMCPVRNKQCLEDECAWWREEEKACAVKIIPGMPEHKG